MSPKSDCAQDLRTLMYRQSGIDAQQLEQWYYDRPFLFGRDLTSQFHCVADGMHALVKGIATDLDRWSDVFGLSASAKRVLSFWKDKPYDPGTYRTDYVFSASGSIKLIEVTCRFALNGYPSHAQEDIIARKQFADLECKIPTQDDFAGFFDYWAQHIGSKRQIIALTGNDKRNESRFLTRAFADTGWDYELIELADIPERVGSFTDAFVYSELALEEFSTLPDAVLRTLASQQMLNDPRTAYMVHDKAFFALISDPLIVQEYLGPAAPDFLRHVLPCYMYTPATAAVWDSAGDDRQNWIVKHRTQGKSQEIYAGTLMDQAAWDALLSRDDLERYILQRFEPQSRFVGLQGGKHLAHYVAGTLLLAGNQYFGPGVIRTCEHPVSNTGALRRIASIVVDAEVTNFGGHWE
jgi:hypothetical protein